MLLSFRISNFKSFRDPQEFSLRRPKRFQSVTSDSSWDPAVSSVASIYGANASGKSTLVQAMQFMRNAVGGSFIHWEVGGGIQVSPFGLDPEFSDLPTEMEIDFRADDGFDYQYGFQVDKKAFLQEWLYVYRTNSRTILFERGFENNSEIKFGNSFKGNKNDLTNAIQTRSNALTLSVGAQLGNPLLLPAFTWITKKLRVIEAEGYRHGIPFTAERVEQDRNFKEKIVSILAKADMGITDIEIQNSELDEQFLSQSRRVFKALNPDFPEDELSNIVHSGAKEIRMTHNGVGGPVQFSFQSESTGTQALLALSGVAYDALESGASLVIDELGTSMHSLLVAELISLFSNALINTRQAQLIFTSHDTTLLNPGQFSRLHLDRDQVWTAQKDSIGASQLRPITEYKAPRKEENLERGYLLGRYGGIPHVSFDFDENFIRTSEV